MSNDANITIDGTTYYFRDYAGDGIVAQLNTEISGNKGNSCYVADKGAYDCNDFPSLCEWPSIPER